MSQQTATATLSEEQKDRALVAELYTKSQQRESTSLLNLEFRNPQIAALLKESDSPSQLFNLLLKNGSFDLNTECHQWTDIDGEQRQLTINRASKTPMWPMGTNFWVRDNALIASRLLNLDYDGFCYPMQWYALGKEILLSCLTVMSSQTQLERFQAIIDEPSLAQDSHHWPHIFLSIQENLNAAKTEPWMHKQDAWQILCYQVLDAIEKGFIKADELSDKQRKLFTLLIPFLKAVDFTNSTNGGSWEEIEAVRSSVIAWELALLDKLKSSPWIDSGDTDALIETAVAKLSKNLPYEAPEKQGASYREADAALIYLLQLDTFQFFSADQTVELRQGVLKQIDTLLGTHGCRRYLGDSYQGLSYYRYETTAKLNSITDSPSGDSSGDEEFQRRSEMIPSGHEAEWTHFDWQLSRYYADRYQETKSPEDKAKQLHYFHIGLSLITGDGEHAIEQSENGDLQIIELPAFRLPECYNTEVHEGEFFKYPSLHTPLYWSIAECLAAFDGYVKVASLPC